MKSILVFTLLIASFTVQAAPAPTFRFHLATEPNSIDPQRQKSSASSYLITSLHRNIFYYDNEKGLVPDLGEKCQRIKGSLICKLKKNLKWSDGTDLSSEDFLNTYKKILDPKNTSPRADLLFKVKNALEIYQGKKPMDSLGISAPDKFTLKFEFAEPAPDFEYSLITLNLAPTKENPQAGTGPYKIKEWVKGKKITLEPNSFYIGGHPDRPLVEILFIEEDSVALQLYEKNQLQFLRRLPTLFIPMAKARPDFHWVPVIRLDYIGFGPELKDHEDIRKAFTYSLNYPELQKIFSSKGAPGCIGLPDSWFPQKAPCYTFDLKKVPPLKKTPTYTMMFSSLGGEDHKRATEWLQNQWQKNAGLKTHLEAKENKVFLRILEEKTPALFRKGVAPDRPTCLAALETFSANSPENFIRFKDPAYTGILQKLGKAKDQNEAKKLCLEGANYLMNRHLIIPLGAIQFAILAKQDFIGWKLNQMNQLDLSQLHSRP
ncbi:putative binding protein YgiS precursor [compost metagenome]